MSSIEKTVVEVPAEAINGNFVVKRTRCLNQVPADQVIVKCITRNNQARDEVWVTWIEQSQIETKVPIRSQKASYINFNRYEQISRICINISRLKDSCFSGYWRLLLQVDSWK